MKKLYLLIIFCSTSLLSWSQYTRHIIQFKDKGGTPHTISNPSTYLSAKSIARRTAHSIAIDSTDLPLTPAYLTALALVPNVQVYNKSKWLNQVLIRTNDPSALATINALPFVKSTKKIADNSVGPVAPVRKSKFNEQINTVSNPAMFGTKTNTGKQQIQSLNYGSSYGQIHIHEGEFLHNKGYTGKDVEMAMMDAGFYGYLTNPAFDSIRLQGRILGTWDYVSNDANVNEDHIHGSLCFSVMTANTPGSIVGTAPHAKFWLFRTEDDVSETPVEEQNWIAAAEFGDSCGVQIFSTSLGYNEFDDPTLSYSHAQRDGNTAMITRAADLAAKKGILVMNSAGNYGNYGNDYKYVLVPADGDSVVAVGAVDVDGNIAAFSSRGPNGAGKIKPNIVSVGVNTIIALPDGTLAGTSGTSLSNPNIAGLMACLWQAFPEISNMQLLDAVQKSAHKYSNPDADFGYGIPNFRKAYNILMAQSFQHSIAYNNSALNINWKMKADTSVSFIIERKTPGATTFMTVDSIHYNNPVLSVTENGRSDSLWSTRPGEYTYRVRVVIGNDTSFTGAEYKFRNQYAGIVAKSVLLNSQFSNCNTELSWQMLEDSNVVYKLERQVPGSNGFTQIASFKGKGSYSNKNTGTYSYTDPISAPLTGGFSYRLHIDLGTDTSFYSNTSSFTNMMPCYTRQGYFFTPVPFKNDVLAIMNTPQAASRIAIVIYDAAGRASYRYEGAKPAGYHLVRIPTYNFTKGVYFATIISDGKVIYKQKIVK